MAQRHEFSKEEIQYMYKAHYNDFQNISLIAEHFNVTRKVIERVFEENGWHVFTHLELVYKKVDQYYFYDIDTPEKAYWLGFITADGGISKKYDDLTIRLNARDDQHLKKFLKCLNAKNHEVKYYNHIITGYPQCEVSICGKTFINGLVQHYIHNGKSGKEVFDLPYDHPYIRDYIRGIWDGDGWISKQHSGCCGSYNILKSIQEVFELYTNRKPTKIRFDSGIYKFDLCGTQQLEWMYYDGCLSLDRKKILVNKKLKGYWTNRKRKNIAVSDSTVVEESERKTGN